MSFELLEGDCVERMAELEEASIDAIVCDPPYGLGFMGKKWDSPDGNADVSWKNAGGPLGRRVEKGDRERGGAMKAGEYDLRLPAMRGFQAWCEAWATEAYRILKPGAHLLAFGGTRTYHRLACAIEDAGFEIRDSLLWLYGSGFPKSHNLVGDWQGWGTALKPSHEPIVVARKPLSGTVAANVLEHGTGALNVDGCRVEHGADVDLEREQRDFDRMGYRGTNGETEGVPLYKPEGRWPANVILSPDSADELDAQSGELVSGANPTRRGADGERRAYGDFNGQADANPQRGIDRGGASRFFYCAKASAGERNAGLDGFDPATVDDGREIPIDNPYLRGETERHNVHPTVKPIDLMRWLVRLVTPPDGTVLDPFTGSGTTGVAAVLEGFDFVGIEREAEYAAIAQARIEWWSKFPVGTATEKALGVAVSDRTMREVGQSPLFP